MSNRCLALASLIVVALVGTANAQGTTQQRAACRGDVARFCKGINDPGTIYSCLQQNSSRISRRCRDVINGR